MSGGHWHQRGAHSLDDSKEHEFYWLWNELSIETVCRLFFEIVFVFSHFDWKSMTPYLFDYIWWQSVLSMIYSFLFLNSVCASFYLKFRCCLHVKCNHSEDITVHHDAKTYWAFAWHKFMYELYFLLPRSGELQTQKSKCDLVRTQSLNFFPLKPVYSHTCYTYCQGFPPCLFLPFLSIHLHFFQNVSQFFPVLAVANIGSCVNRQNKIGHPAGCRFHVENMICGITCEMNNLWDRVKCVFSPDVILCGWLGAKHQLPN